ncbi:unnamed protein product [Diatraea saccharalis]|uniref:2-methoxy-6-polyprenyl-1,4-benzoquinol methylase, mitochondrial n=1 Tax=Diatraea saccharalis TaxID=40085 RepID=A0A9N9R7V8_9NEOP|nr:unnamed protein product [Diatraea saccharalis]
MPLRRITAKLLKTRASVSFFRTRPLVTQVSDKESERHSTKQTHFGYQTVDEEEKWKKVHEVFETVAEKYDLMNDAMSFGIHRLWKDIFMARLAPTHGTKLLDMAGGTGDITFRYINYLKNLNPPPEDKKSSVTVCDINQAMLDVGKVRAEKQGYTWDRCGVSVEWVCGDAEQLQLPDDTFTAYTIAFGIRNCTHVDRVLEEAYRVLAPGGRFMCLEFSHIPNDALQWVYDQYSFQVIPVLGQLIAGQWRPYQYLVESIRQFPNQEKFKSMIEDAGFRQVTYENLTFGTCAIHSGFKI